MAAQIDCKRVAQRLKRVVDDWKRNRLEAWGSADALLIALGKQTEVEGLKITALQMFLLGYEFPELTFVVTEKALFCMVAEKRANKYFGTLQEEVTQAGLGLEVHMLHFQKGQTNADHHAAIAAGVKSSFAGLLVGSLVKEKQYFNTGKALPPLLLHLEAQSVAYVDMRRPVSEVMSIKDEGELFAVKRAAQLTAKVFQKLFKAKIMDAAENSTDVTAEALCKEIDQQVEDLSARPDLLGQLDPQSVEQSYPAMLRTGTDAGEPFVIGLENSTSKVTYDVALLSLGLKFENYHSCVTRTLIFNASQYQLECYQHLVEAFEAGMRAIVPGEPVKSIHAGAYLRMRAPRACARARVRVRVW
jgi:nucleosome binding factor SPN SPT16 subunit